MAGERDLYDCGYACPYSEAGHTNYRAGHDFVFLAPSPEPLPREALEDGPVREALIFVAYDIPDNPADPMAALRAAQKKARAALSPDRPTPP